MPGELKHGRPTELTMQWANRGAAPCYSADRLEVSLFDGQGRFVLAAASQMRPGVREWEPGKEVTVQAPVEVPGTVPAGDYTIKLRLLSGVGAGHTRPVAVATKGADPEGRYTVGTVHVAD